jgi:hypothetical protein
MLQLPLITTRAVVLAVLATSLAALPAAQEGVVVHLDPSTLDLRPGETAELTVWIDDVTDLAGAEIHLTYDPALVEIVDADMETSGSQVAHGGFLAADFVALNQADTEQGSVDYAVARKPPHSPASGSGPLAVLTLRGLQSGETTVTIREVILANPDGYPIPVTIEPSAATVTVSSRQILPGTCGPWALVVLGTAAYFIVARRP